MVNSLGNARQKDTKESASKKKKKKKSEARGLQCYEDESMQVLLITA